MRTLSVVRTLPAIIRPPALHFGPRASMTTPAAMKREPIGAAVMAIRPLLMRLMRRLLSAGDE
jgi:hypothetical protein